MVHLKKVLSSTPPNIGYLLVYAQHSPSHPIAISCVISTMCISDVEYQLINPTTQVALISHCLDNCSSIENIQWNIYNGTINPSTNITHWSLFNKPVLSFGNNTNRFTVTKELFLKYHYVQYWQFEVIYLFDQVRSSSSINFKVNQQSSTGSCSIDPLNGTITTLFHISCSNWFDENQIKDYSVYAWKNDNFERLMIGFSVSPIFQVRLPSGEDNNSLLHIVINIRDTFNRVEEYKINTSVYVYDDSTEIENLFHSFQDSPDNLINNSFVYTLLIGNQNDVGQIIRLVLEQLNKMSNDKFGPIVSTLDNQISQSEKNSVVLNKSLIYEYNIYANIREYLVNFTTNLTIAGIQSIILQASSLVQLTEAPNQLTRITSIIASKRCYELTVALKKISKEISFEDVQKASNLLSQCSSNILHSSKSPLQERTMVLDLDLLRSNEYFHQDNQNKLQIRSLTWIDQQYGQELFVKTNPFIEFIIPRDPNLNLSGLNLQNVLKIYDQRKELKDEYDGWTIFCSLLTNESIYEYYIDNEELSKHQSLIFGLRELAELEYENVCLKNSTQD